ncbi:rngB [Symbiodinium sp. CCMP2592]|nr:rngB [Symbiodinium sp. CCMP2592]
MAGMKMLPASFARDSVPLHLRGESLDQVRLVWLVPILAQLVEANYWEQLSPSGTPPSVRFRHGDAAVWSPAAHGFYVFGGEDDNGNLLNDSWIYRRCAFFVKYWATFHVNYWEQLSPSGTAPSGRTHHTAVWSAAANGFYVFGGYDGPGLRARLGAARQQPAMLRCGNVLNDLWFYGSEASEGDALFFCVKYWQIPAPRGVLLGATFHVNYWEQLSPNGTAPSVRYGHTAVWSPAANGFYVFGGNGGGSSIHDQLNDLWFWREASEGVVLQEMLRMHFFVKYWQIPAPRGVLLGATFHANSSWEQLSPDGTAPSARRLHTAVWSAAANGFYVFGGFDDGGNVLNDLWFYGSEASEGVVLDAEDALYCEALANPSTSGHVSQANSWEQLSPSGTAPSVRNGHTAVWSPAANGFYVFGGNGGNLLNDLWFYGREASEGHRELLARHGSCNARFGC